MKNLKNNQTILRRIIFIILMVIVFGKMRNRNVYAQELQEKYWFGDGFFCGVDVKWENASCWSPAGVPTKFDNVIISNEHDRNPIVTEEGAVANSIEISEGKTLTIRPDGSLKVFSKIINDPYYNNDIGKITLDGNLYSYGDFYNFGKVEIGTDGYLSVQGSVYNKSLDNKPVAFFYNGGIVDIASNGAFYNGTPTQYSAFINYNEYFYPSKIIVRGKFVNYQYFKNGDDSRKSGVLSISGYLGVFENLGELKNYNLSRIDNDGFFFNGTLAALSQGTIENYGEFNNNFQLTNRSGNVITNEKEGKITNNSNGTLINEETAVININVDSKFFNSGILRNKSQYFTNNGTFENHPGGKVENQGLFENWILFTNMSAVRGFGGELVNSGKFMNLGTLINEENAVLTNAPGGKFVNEVALQNSSLYFTNKRGNNNEISGELINSGTFTNTAKGALINEEMAVLTNNEDGEFVNYGELQNSSLYFTNNGSMVNSGSFDSSYAQKGQLANNGMFQNLLTSVFTGSISSFSNSQFRNLGQVTIRTNEFLDLNAPSLFWNFGYLVNDGRIIIPPGTLISIVKLPNTFGTLENNGTITGDGFNNGGEITVCSTGTIIDNGTISPAIDIYCPTNSDS